MVVSKRIQKQGNSHAIILTKKMLNYLGIDPQNLAENTVKVEGVRGALIITREDRELDRTQDKHKMVYAAKHTRRKPLPMREDRKIPITGSQLELCELLLRKGPMRPRDIIKEVEAEAGAVYTTLTRAYQQGLLVRENSVYSLSPTVFDI